MQVLYDVGVFDQIKLVKFWSNTLLSMQEGEEKWKQIINIGSVCSWFC